MALRKYLIGGLGYNCVQQALYNKGALTVCTCTSDMCNYKDIHSLMEFSRISHYYDGICENTRCENPKSYVCVPSERVEHKDAFGVQCQCMLSPSCSHLPRYGHFLKSQQMIKPESKVSRVLKATSSSLSETRIVASQLKKSTSWSVLGKKSSDAFTSSAQPKSSLEAPHVINATNSVQIVPTSSLDETSVSGKKSIALNPSSHSLVPSKSIGSAIEPSSVLMSGMRSQSVSKTTPLPIVKSVSGGGAKIISASSVKALLAPVSFSVESLVKRSSATPLVPSKDDGISPTKTSSFRQKSSSVVSKDGNQRLSTAKSSSVPSQSSVFKGKDVNPMPSKSANSSAFVAEKDVQKTTPIASSQFPGIVKTSVLYPSGQTGVIQLPKVTASSEIKSYLSKIVLL